LWALPYGPVHREVLHFIQGQRYDQERWSKAISVEGRNLRLSHDPGVGALSRYEIGILNEISQRHSDAEDFDIARITEAYDEYVKTYPQGTGTSVPISFEMIIDAVGGDREKILKDAHDKAIADQILS
jgi:hypothetical protein